MLIQNCWCSNVSIISQVVSMIIILYCITVAMLCHCLYQSGNSYKQVYRYSYKLVSVWLCTFHWVLNIICIGHIGHIGHMQYLQHRLNCLSHQDKK